MPRIIHEAVPFEKKGKAKKIGSCKFSLKLETIREVEDDKKAALKEIIGRFSSMMNLATTRIGFKLKGVKVHVQDL